MPNLTEILHPRPHPNLLDQVKRDRPPTPPGYYKGIALDICAVGIALFSGYLLKLFLDYRQFFFPFLGGVLLFLIISFFGALLIDGWRRRAVTHLLQSAAFVSWFYALPIEYVSLAGGALFLFLLWGSGLGRAEIANTIEFKFLKIARPVMTKLVTGIALAAIFLYLPTWNVQDIFISQSRFEALYNSIAKTGNVLYDKVNFSSTIGDFVRGIAKTQLSQNALFASFPPEAQNKVLEEGVSRLLSGAEKSLGIPLSPQMSVAEVLYEYTVSLLDKWRTKLGPTFLAIWAVAVFLIARSVGVLFVWLALLVAYLIFELLSAFDIIHISGESRTREIVEFS